MIRALVEQTFDSTRKYLVMFGLSTDTKPTSGLITGSEFHEVDTGVKYEFDEVGAEWHDVGITEQEIKDEIDAWLDAHPEATTTVEDGAITNAKLASSFVSPGVASAFSTSNTYAVGDYCFYNGTLYRFTSAHSAGAWNASDVTEVDVGGELVYLKNDFDSSLSVKTAKAENGMAVKINPILGTKIKVEATADSTTPVYLNQTGINMLPFPHRWAVGTKTVHNVDFTENSDGTITVNGTADEEIKYDIWLSSVRTICAPTKGNLYQTLVGCPEGGSESTYYLEFSWLGSKDTGNGVTYRDSGYSYWSKQRSYIRIVIKNGTQMNNLVFKPMVYFCDSNTNLPYHYDDYVPYIGNSKLLTAQSENHYVVDEELVALDTTQPNYVFIVADSNTNNDTEPLPHLECDMSVSYYSKLDEDIAELNTEIETLKTNTNEAINYRNMYIFGIGHRGTTVGFPENTMPAFKEARRKGFRSIEFDVTWTSDDVPVIIHDASINRTGRNADGTSISSTTYVNDLTYDEISEYDFGVWKGSQFAGTKIPTFEETIAFCRNAGLIPLVEIKSEYATQSLVEDLIDTVRNYGLIDDIYWVSNATVLGYIKAELPTANLIYASWKKIDSDEIATLTSLQNGTNKVFGTFPQSLQDATSFGLLINAKIPYFPAEESNNSSAILALTHYASAIISGDFLPEKVLYDNAMA